MKKIITTAVSVLLAALSIAACGGASLSDTDLASQMEQGDWNGNGSATKVTCVKKGKSTYTCMGTFRPSIKGAKAATGGIEPDAETLRTLTAPQQVSWEVTVDSDGAWIAEPN